MQASDLKDYINRWRAVEEIEREEALAMTTEDRWRQLNAIYGIAQALGLLEKMGDDGEEEVWARWNKLRGLDDD